MESLSFGDLSSFKNKKVFIFTLGKNAIPMAKRLIKEAKNNKIEIESRPLIITKSLTNPLKMDFEAELIIGDHPILGENSFKAGEIAIEELEKLGEDVILFFGVSGGGSSLLECPLDPFTKNDLIELSKALIKSGAGILEMNLLRSEVSELKRGGLLKFFKGLKVVNFIASDIPSDDCSIVSSGPTLYKENPPNLIKEIGTKYLSKKLREKILENLNSKNRGKKQNLLKKNNQSKNIKTNIIANFETLINIISKVMKNEKILIFNKPLNFPFEEGREWFLNQIKHMGKKETFFSGGELSIKYEGKGVGGRNTHFTLDLGLAIFQNNILGLSNEELKECSLGSLATDGDDGSTSCAGAFMDWDIYQKGVSLNLNIEDFLKLFNSFEYFKRTGGVIELEQTELNLMDLRFFSKKLPSISKRKSHV